MQQPKNQRKGAHYNCYHESSLHVRKTQKCVRKAVNKQLARAEEQKQQEAVEWAITDKKDIKKNKKLEQMSAPKG